MLVSHVWRVIIKLVLVKKELTLYDAWSLREVSFWRRGSTCQGGKPWLCSNRTWFLVSVVPLSSSVTCS